MLPRGLVSADSWLLWEPCKFYTLNKFFPTPVPPSLPLCSPRLCRVPLPGNGLLEIQWWCGVYAACPSLQWRTATAIPLRHLSSAQISRSGS